MDKTIRIPDWAGRRPASFPGKGPGIAATLCLLLLLSPGVRADMLHDPSGNTLWQDAVTSGGHVAASGGYTLTGATGEVSGPLSLLPTTHALFHGIPGPLWQFGPPPNAIAITGAQVGSTVAFSVTFDKEVEGFDASSDLDLVVTSGSVTWSTVSISDGPITYQVDVSGVAGTGTMTLAVSTASDVMDLVGNPLASSVTSGPVAIATSLPVAAPPGLILMATAVALAGAWEARKRKSRRGSPPGPTGKWCLEEL